MESTNTVCPWASNRQPVFTIHSSVAAATSRCVDHLMSGRDLRTYIYMVVGHLVMNVYFESVWPGSGINFIVRAGVSILSFNVCSSRFRYEATLRVTDDTRTRRGNARRKHSNNRLFYFRRIRNGVCGTVDKIFHERNDPKKRCLFSNPSLDVFSTTTKKKRVKVKGTDRMLSVPWKITPVAGRIGELVEFGWGGRWGGEGAMMPR